jgi:GT2 family glycosyltransferase
MSGKKAGYRSPPDVARKANYRSMPELTVIIPTYERQAQTLLAIESVACQGVEAEIIIVDDASPTPFSLSPLLGRRANTIKLIRRSENGGAGAARNTGIAAASSDIITFLDSDDCLLPGTLRRRLDFALDPPLGFRSDAFVTVGGGWVESHDGVSSGSVRVPLPSSGPDDFFGGCWMCPGSAVLFHREIFEKVGGFDEKLRRLEDLDLFIRIGRVGGRYISHPAAAAIIHKSAAKSGADIEAAAKLLVQKYTQATVTKKQLRLLKAYLQLELAAGARRAGRHGEFLRRFALSMLHSPRLRVFPGPGWRRLDGS